MKREHVLVAIAVLALSAALTGCSQDGDLTIVNDSASKFRGALKGDRITIEPGESMTENIYIGKTFAFIGPDEIDVTLSGLAWTKREFTEEVTVKSGETTTYRIVDDIGACYIQNMYGDIITAIKIKRCADQEFGPNLMEGEINTGRGFLLQLDDGCWDVHIIYTLQVYSYYIEDMPMHVGDIIRIYWHPDSTYTF